MLRIGGNAAICYARIYVPWDAVNNGKGSFAGRHCTRRRPDRAPRPRRSPTQLSAAARAVGASHVLVSLTTAPTGSPDDIWPTDAEYECGLSGLERAAPGVREWEVFNEPDSNYAGRQHRGRLRRSQRRVGPVEGARERWVSSACSGAEP